MTVQLKRQPEYLKYNLTYDAYSLGAGAKYNFNKRSYIQFDIKNDNYDTNYLYTNEDGDNKGWRRKCVRNGNIIIAET